jgi:hypothetical protein
VGGGQVTNFALPRFEHLSQHRRALLGLGVALEELLREGLAEAFVRGTALYWLARVRFDDQPLENTAVQARAALGYACEKEIRDKGISLPRENA